jgi:hypothetical protein
MNPEETFKQFKQIALGRIPQDQINAILDDVRNDAVERILYKYNIIPKSEVDEEAAKQLQKIIEVLKNKPQIYAINSNELLDD